MLNHQAPVLPLIPPKRPRRSQKPLAPLSQYEADCLAGRCFPNPGDTRMEQRCREEHRLREWIELFRRFHMANLSPRTHYKSYFNVYFPPLLDVKPRELTRQAVQQWVTTNGQHSHYQANHAFRLLRTMYHKMRTWGYDGPNPTDGIKPFRLQSRARFIQEDEMPRILNSLLMEDQRIQLFFLLTLLTGSRPGEVLVMKWADFRITEEVVKSRRPDGSAEHRRQRVGIWTKPTTKNRLPQTVPLPPELTARLEQLSRDSVWVFAGSIDSARRNAPGPMSYSAAHKYWVRVRERAGLPDVRPYDLRRTCASWLAIDGANAVLIAKILNHTSLQHTAVYTRLNTAPVATALNMQSDRILNYAGSRIVHGEAVVDGPTARQSAEPEAVHPSETDESRDLEMDWPG